MKRKIASRENKIFENFRPGCGLFPAVAAMTRATATRQRNTIFAKRQSCELHRVKTAATRASLIFIGQNGWLGFNKCRCNFIAPLFLVGRLSTSSNSRLSEILRQRDRLAHRHGLVDRLLKFRFRRRVVHPTAASLNVSLAVFDQRRANRDAAIQISVK